MHNPEYLEQLRVAPLEVQFDLLKQAEENNKKFEESISPEKKLLIQDYVIKLRRKFPQMKEARLMRKTAEYFHIKLM